MRKLFWPNQIKVNVKSLNNNFLLSAKNSTEVYVIRMEDFDRSFNLMVFINFEKTYYLTQPLILFVR